jgi:2,3-bisphosphoglycerate-dependent phosphoglycerate mutase
MDTILYLIRHAQSHLRSECDHSEWPLSSLGKQQAEQLAGLLSPLGITTLFSSPFTRCLQTVTPFAKQAGIDIRIEEDLRERLVAKTIRNDFRDVWRKSWEDFDFALPGCETSAQAQRRFFGAVAGISQSEAGCVLAISTHGNVIGLFLNAIDDRMGQCEADKLMNPDVVKIVRRNGGFHWDRAFELSGLREIASDYRETPIEGRSADR